MSTDLEKRHWRTLVVGGGQAGLAVGYYLAQQGDDFAILDAAARTGDSWRQRWDSLRLFTPAKHDGLPGMPFPAPPDGLPTRDEMADYLAAYAARFELPVRHGVRVERLQRTAGGYRLETSGGVLTAERVVLATGTQPVPRVPSFASALDPAIHQVHASAYRNPASLPGADVLVVGAGTSGVELAVELAATRPTRLAGKPTPHIPDALLRYAGGLYWWFVSHVLTTRTPMGRKARPKVRGGGAPLIRISSRELAAAGVERVPRVTGVKDGRPQLADGRVLDVSTIVWATGYRPDFSWVDFPLTDESGWPAGDRGVSSLAPGVYFVGVPFQYGLTSGLVGGVGRDAAHVAQHLARGATPALAAAHAPVS